MDYLSSKEIAEDAVKAIAARFNAGDSVVDIRPYGRGNINDTFLVTFHGRQLRRAILQRINPTVFPEPVLIMENLRTLLDHVDQSRHRLKAKLRGLKLPQILKTQEGEDFYRDGEGGFWRALSFIDGAQSIDTLENLAQAEALGATLGLFHVLLHDLEIERLHDTLPNFHVTPQYLARYDQIFIRRDAAGRSTAMACCVEFIESRRGEVRVLEDARDRGLIAVRPIHGDPKLNNILFHARSGRPMSLVDFDTVKPGLLHYDIGDCLRSCCNRAGESPSPSATVEFDLKICRAVLKGYFSVADECLAERDYAYLPSAIWLLPFELGLRFLTDYLDGNRYFKVATPEQNLHRALTQFRLVESIERNEIAIRRAIAELSNHG